MNKKLMSVLMVLALAFVLTTVAGCGNKVDSKLNGTWVNVTDEVETVIKLSNGKVESTSPLGQMKGTYTTNDGKISWNYTDIFPVDDNFFEIESKWYSNNEFIMAIKPFLMGHGVSEREFNKFISDMLTPPESSYSVDKNSLILTTSSGGRTSSVIFTKK